MYLALQGLALLILAQLFGVLAAAYLIYSGHPVDAYLERLITGAVSLSVLAVLYRPVSRRNRLAVLLCFLFCLVLGVFFALDIQEFGVPTSAVAMAGPAATAVVVLGLGWWLLLGKRP